MTFSEQILYGMFKPAKYKELINLKTRRFVLFVVVLMLVLGVVSFVIPTGAIITGFGGFEELFLKKIRPMEYSNGQLTIEKSFEMSFDYNNILIDTSEETPTDEMLDRDGMYFAIGSKNLRMAFVNDKEILDWAVYSLSDLLPEGFDNQMLCDAIPSIYLYLGFSFLVNCLGFFIKYAVIALFYSLFLNSIKKRMELNLSYGKIFQICFYGQSFGIILSNFNIALGLLPSFIVSMIGIFISVHMITTSFLFLNPKNQV